MNGQVPFPAAMVCGRGRSSGRNIVVVVATMAKNFDSGALVVLVVTVVGAEVSCDTRFTVGDLTRAHALLQVPLSAAMLCGHGRDRGRVGGCSRNNGQGFFGSGGGCRSPSSIIGTGDLPRASCRSNMRLCTQGGLGFCAFIAIARHIQVPTRQLAVYEFGMNVLVLVRVCGLLL